ncbi:major facilitator transporter [Arthrobacter sp. PAMC 25486]|uniref:MFS transporter n=1 Tax=Arthrobacter sp. PAMC 25486 TaxID=1494608 RepID=UPI000535FC3F|nr:MFS transporter [Arthrobacter sp. PAMC 25486]AIY01525.1 major facilitator transporter [Arthrobacter sp. PAMC 25486]
MALSFKHKLLLATPVPATWMSNVIIHNVYIKFYTDVIGLSPEYVGWVYLAFNFWNILNDPVFGFMLDKMKYRPGRGKFLLVMRRTIPFMLVGLAAMAWSSPSWPEGVIFTVFLLQLFLFDVASTFYLISAISYGFLAAPTREDRIDVEVVKTWVGNISSAFATILATQLLVGDAITEHTTMATLLMGVVLLNAALYLIPAIKLKDPPELYERGDAGEESVTWTQLKKDAKSIMSMRAFWAWFAFGTTALAPMGMYFTAFLYLMDHVIRSSGTEATIADIGSMVVVLVLLPLLARAIKRLGSRTAIYIAFVPYLGGLSALFFVTQWWHMLIAYMFIMTGRYMMTTAGVALEGALIDDNERLTGTRKTGSFASLRALMSAPLTGTQTTIFMWVIAAYGYEQSAEVQSAAAQWGIRFATAGVPILFGVLGIVALLFLPYNKKIEAEISEFSRARRGEGTAFVSTGGNRGAAPLMDELDQTVQSMEGDRAAE